MKQAIRVDHAISDRASQQGLRPYLSRVILNSSPPRRFGEVWEPWQVERINAIEAPLEHIANFRTGYTGPLNYYFGYSKGHDKTSFVARLFNWLLAYSRRSLRIYAAAADADQARLIRDAMQSETDQNPWLRKRVNIYNKIAWGKGGTLEILAADAASAQGKIFDLLVADEVTHWRSPDLWDALYSARNKRPQALVLVLTNAGIKDGWQWRIRETARTSDRWHFFEQPQGVQLASWMDAKAIAEDRKLLTPIEARRLLDNEWVSPGEADGFISYDEAIACRTLGVGEGDCRSRYFIGVDYGPRKDRTALAVVRRDADDSLTVTDLQHWHRPGGEVQVEEVERWMEQQHAKYPNATFVLDLYQLLSTAQKYEKLHYQIERFAPRGGAANYELAANLRSLIASRRIKWRERSGPTLPHTDVLVSGADTFEDELSQLLLRVTPSGYRFDHKSGKHDDRAVAVGMAALFAVNAKPLAQFAPPQPIAQPRFDFKSPPRRTFFGA